MKNLIIPANVLITIQNYCNERYKDLKPLQVDKMIEATIMTWDVLYSIYSQYNTDEYGYFYVYSQNKELQSISVVVDGVRYRYSTFIKILTDTLILVPNPNKYSTGNDTTKAFTKSYKLNCEMDGLYEYKINYYKYKRDVEYDREEFIKMYPDHKNLINTLYQIRIDIPSLFENINSRIGESRPPRTIKTKYRTVIDTHRVIDNATIYRILYDALRINNRYIHYTVKNRVYSSFTGMSSLVHDYIFINGVKMVELDVVNCQPLLLNIYLKDDKMKRACERGVFYDELMEATGITNRDEIKILCYRDLFFGDYKPNSRLGKAFQELYPDAHTQLHTFVDDIDEKLASILQNIESEIFIGYAKELDYPVITKHDALLVPINKIYSTKADLLNRFESYGLRPMFK